MSDGPGPNTTDLLQANQLTIRSVNGLVTGFTGPPGLSAGGLTMTPGLGSAIWPDPRTGIISGQNGSGSGSTTLVGNCAGSATLGIGSSGLGSMSGAGITYPVGTGLQSSLLGIASPICGGRIHSRMPALARAALREKIYAGILNYFRLVSVSLCYLLSFINLSLNHSNSTFQ
ncbi:unnamed protein product [Protopolystoma xenopodis]|uniref:Uncharacterized protein n=1 Tax=Protopolystoma xenopodis TaxID=117903 RepID=A0A448X2M3_9PLAT|nr:unnamed protein product [Protopolystoma xenopodis]